MYQFVTNDGQTAFKRVENGRKQEPLKCVRISINRVNLVTRIFKYLPRFLPNGLASRNGLKKHKKVKIVKLHPYSESLHILCVIIK